MDIRDDITSLPTQDNDIKNDTTKEISCELETTSNGNQLSDNFLR